jgi:hypothetical protein
MSSNSSTMQSNKGTNCGEWMPNGPVGKAIIIFHFMVIAGLIIILTANYSSIKSGAFAGGIINVVIGGIIGYYYIYSLWCCGGVGGKLILVPTILFDLLIIIGLLMYFYTEASGDTKYVKPKNDYVAQPEDNNNYVELENNNNYIEYGNDFEGIM